VQCSAAVRCGNSTMSLLIFEELFSHISSDAPPTSTSTPTSPRHWPDSARGERAMQPIWAPFQISRLASQVPIQLQQEDRDLQELPPANLGIYRDAMFSIHHYHNHHLQCCCCCCCCYYYSLARRRRAPHQSQHLGVASSISSLRMVQCDGFGISQDTSPSMFHSISDNRALQKPHPYTAASGPGIGPSGASFPHRRRLPPAAARFSSRVLQMSHPRFWGFAASHAARSRRPHPRFLLLC
jgi:hypothetical protein